MANIIIPPRWRIVESLATDHSLYVNRRAFVKTLGLGAVGASALMGCTGERRANANGTTDNEPDGPLATIPPDAPRDGYPAARNEKYQVPERAVTDRLAASSYNNFYEFDASSKKVWHLTGNYDPYPWEIEVTGLVEKPLKFDLGDLIRTMPLEERLYRFRCVEAWSMTIPWTGFPLRDLINRCAPLSTATHVRFVSANRKSEMPGISKTPWYPWPYYEGLRMDEAMNELAFVATGMYGEPLTKQNGSPLRLALPWKYGYKGPKAVVRIEFTSERPPTFWNDLQPAEYGFFSNVNPGVPHPRWSQATERFMRTENDIERVPTSLFNGYEEWVGALYPRESRG